MEPTQQTSLLTLREQQAIDNINAVLNGDGSAPESGPGAWADCGEVDVPVLLDAIARLSKPAAQPAPASDALLAELEALDLAGIATTAAICSKMRDNGQRIVKADTSDWARVLTQAATIGNALPALLARVRQTEAPFWIPPALCLPAPMPDENFGFDKETSAEQRADERCSADKFVVVEESHDLPTGLRTLRYAAIARYWPATGLWYGDAFPALNVVLWADITIPAALTPAAP